MSIEKEIEETEKALKQEVTDETPIEEVEDSIESDDRSEAGEVSSVKQENPKQTEKGDKKNKPGVQEKTKGDAKEEKVEAKDDLPAEPTDNSAWAKMRVKYDAEKKKSDAAERKAKELEEKLVALEKRITQPQQQQTQQEQPTPEQQHAQELQAHRQYLQNLEQERIINQAKRQFDMIVSDYKRSQPDYDEAVTFAMEKERANLKNLYPDAPDYLIQQTLDNDLLKRAGFYHQRGYNPAEAIYAHIVDYYGYSKKDPESKANTKPDLKLVEKNKQKTQTLSGKGASGKQTMTASALEQLSLDELEKQSPEEIRAALEMG